VSDSANLVNCLEGSRGYPLNDDRNGFRDAEGGLRATDTAHSIPLPYTVLAVVKNCKQCYHRCTSACARENSSELADKNTSASCFPYLHDVPAAFVQDYAHWMDTICRRR
jgi:hypothetical protein